MTKTEALQKLKEHGIELMCVTQSVYRFTEECDARMVRFVNPDYIVPTKEQYNQIIDIIGESGLYAIMCEHIEHKNFFLWSSSSSSEDSSCAWHLRFTDKHPNESFFLNTPKNVGLQIAFWKFSETPKQKKIKHIKKTIMGLQKKLDELKNS